MIRLSSASLSFDGFGDIDFVKTFAKAPALGYRYIEFNCWYPRTLTDSKMRDLLSRCRQTGLQASSMHISSIGGENAGITKDVCHKLQALKVAKGLGASLVAMTGYPRGTNGGLDGIIQTLKVVAPEAKDMGMKLSLENHVGNNIENIEDYSRILDAIPFDNVGICIDTGHFDAANVDMYKLIDQLGDRVNHIHLKENKGMGTKMFTRFREGTTDNFGVIDAMIKRGYDGYLVIEVSPEIGEHDGRPFTDEDLALPFEMFNSYLSE